MSAPASDVAFKQATADSRVAMSFPADHASHAGFQTEWWYVTGNVKSETGREFGYQFTIFRRAIDARSPQERGRKSPWAIGDVYLGHLAISDITEKKFYFEESVQRGNVGLAGATDHSEFASAAKDLQAKVWLGTWSFTRFGDSERDAPLGWKLHAREGDIEISLTLTETIAPIPHGRDGEEGLSRKGPQEGQASFYYSVAGLSTTGTIKIKDAEHTIASGRSWMDHEWGSNQLAATQAGWDWFSIQLDGGGVLMLYRLRHKDGTVEPASSGTWLSPDGKRTHLKLDEVQLKPGRTWTSPASSGQYAVEWMIEIPKLALSLKVAAAHDDQELKPKSTAGLTYYEGAIRVTGTLSGKDVKGDGYLEITGAPGQKSAGRGLGGML
ncbi:MAG TPA: lipocalin-like domain-containing protein [Planctomycetota bacterium]|nr:lipocalin-like domain-containing protein [Planctomycetota bacterium]